MRRTILCLVVGLLVMLMGVPSGVTAESEDVPGMCKSIRSRAFKYLEAHQNEDGSFGKGDMQAVTTFFVLAVFESSQRGYRGHDGPAFSKAQQWLAGQRDALKGVAADAIVSWVIKPEGEMPALADLDAALLGLIPQGEIPGSLVAVARACVTAPSAEAIKALADAQVTEAGSRYGEVEIPLLDPVLGTALAGLAADRARRAL